jgi:hypothetical protein
MTSILAVLQPVARNVRQRFFDGIVDQITEGLAVKSGVAGPATQKNRPSGFLENEISVAFRALDT